MEQRRKLRWNRFKSGCGSVWLERCVRDAEAGGSNPLTPTIFLFSEIQSFMAGFFLYPAFTQ